MKMPPRVATKKRAAKDVAGKSSTDDKALEIDLAEMDIQVDEWKTALEHEMEETIAAMKRIVEITLMKLPPRIRSMPVGTLLNEYGGQTACVLQNEMKMNKLARTVAKSHTSAASRVATLLKGQTTMSRVHGLLGEADDKEPTDGHASKVMRTATATSVANGKPIHTPAAPKMRSVLAPAAHNVPQTPKIGGAMKSMVAPTPMLNPLLPKTPAVRRPRRGEVLYAVSANGSPVGQVNVDKAVRASIAIRGAAPTTTDEDVPSGAAADIQLDLGDGCVVDDEESVARVMAEKGAEAVMAGIEAMAAKVEAMRAAATAAAKGLAVPGSAMHMSKLSRVAAAVK